MQVDCDDEFDRCLTQTLIQHWDGTAWTIVPSPNVSSTDASFLIGVRCPSDSECWAVGVGQNGGENQTLIEHFDGDSWTIVASPNLGVTEWNQLFDLDCASPNDCWAVGSYAVNVGPPYYEEHSLTLTFHWDGSAWTTVPSPNGSESNNGLGAIDCTSSSYCWAGGSHYSDGGETYLKPLFELYSPNIPALISVASRKMHGDTPFDIDLLGNNAVEGRMPGATGTIGVDHKIVFSFINNVANCGQPTTGSLTIGPAANQCTVNLAGIPNQHTVAVSLSGVVDVANNTGSVSAEFRALIGDVTGNGAVSNTDVSNVKGQVSAPVTSSNFRHDVTANGAIGNTDVSTVKGQVGTTVP
ncbi:MAG TPA: dockerin type I domain-containing protein [Chthoniobacterales bacterium]|nr:dockerin type I domain-containing protein [Chthoniobacterales bacterium]